MSSGLPNPPPRTRPRNGPIFLSKAARLPRSLQHPSGPSGTLGTDSSAHTVHSSRSDSRNEKRGRSTACNRASRGSAGNGFRCEACARASEARACAFSSTNRAAEADRSIASGTSAASTIAVACRSTSTQRRATQASRTASKPSWAPLSSPARCRSSSSNVFRSGPDRSATAQATSVASKVTARSNASRPRPFLAMNGAKRCHHCRRTRAGTHHAAAAANCTSPFAASETSSPATVAPIPWRTSKVSQSNCRCGAPSPARRLRSVSTRSVGTALREHRTTAKPRRRQSRRSRHRRPGLPSHLR